MSYFTKELRTILAKDMEQTHQTCSRVLSVMEVGECFISIVNGVERGPYLILSLFQIDESRSHRAECMDAGGQITTHPASVWVTQVDISIFNKAEEYAKNE